MHYILYWFDSATKERHALRFEKREDAYKYREEKIVPNDDIDFSDIYVPEGEYLWAVKSLEETKKKIALAINELKREVL